MKKFKEVAINAAKEAGKLLMDRISTIQKISYKGEINIVTEVDTLSEKLILDQIRKEFPDHQALAEETGAHPSSSSYRWIIDPIDGTTNYAHGFPFFCVSIALEREKEIILGVVFEPFRKELFVAEKGKGSFLNEKKIVVSSTQKLLRSLLATGFAYNVKDTRNNNLDHFQNFLMNSQAVRRAGSAALDLCYTACGRLDGFWEMNLNPWDTAAGLLIVTEAGGKVTDFRGKKYDPFIKQIAASNGIIHDDMLKVLNKERAKEK